MFDKLNPYFLYTPDDPPVGDDPPKSDVPPADDPPKKPDGGGEEKKEYTQAELDAMFADRAKRAGSKALTDLYAGLGLKDAKELKALVADVKKKADDEKSDLEKAQTSATDWETKHSALAESQKRDRVRYAVESAARKQNVIESAVPDVYALVDQSSIGFDDNEMPESESVEGAVKTVLETRKHMVQVNGARTDNDADKGTGGAQVGKHTDAEYEEMGATYGIDPKYMKEGARIK